MANPSVVVDFIANTQQLVAGIKGMTGATDDAAKSSKKISGKALVAWGAAGVALGFATKYVKDATSATEDMAKSTLALQRVTGMDTETASQWVAVLKSRNISADTFGKSMTILSKQIVGATDGSKKSVAAFEKLGVSMADVRAGDTQKVLMEVSDGLKGIQNPAQRAALTQQLFGRSSAKLTPLLYAGSAAIQEQLDTANKFGETLDGKTVGSVKDLAASQRDMEEAMSGIQIQLGTALIPLLASLAEAFVEVLKVVQPLIANATVMKIALGVLATALIAYKVATIAAAIATTVFDAAAAPVALTAIAIVAAIAALIVIGVLLYQHWDELSALASKVWATIQAGVQSFLSWLSANWPLIVGILVGPFGIAAALIYTHWNTIKTQAAAAWAAIKSTITTVLSAILGAITTTFATITDTITRLLATIQAAFTTAWNTIKNVATGAMATVSSAVTSTWNSLVSFFAALGARLGSALAAVHTWLSKPGEWAHDAVNAAEAAFNGLVSFITGLAGRVAGAMSGVANAMRAPINAVIGAWNSLSFTVPSITIPGFPGVKVAGKTIVPGWGGTTIGGYTIGFPNVPKLASGGVFDQATLAVVGEAGREIVAPESLLRSMLAEARPEVRVFIGDRELRDLVRVEVVTEQNRTAQTLMAGLA